MHANRRGGETEFRDYVFILSIHKKKKVEICLMIPRIKRNNSHSLQYLWLRFDSQLIAQFVNFLKFIQRIHLKHIYNQQNNTSQSQDFITIVIFSSRTHLTVHADTSEEYRRKSFLLHFYLCCLGTISHDFQEQKIHA